jgi:hypothetical protein
MMSESTKGRIVREAAKELGLSWDEAENMSITEFNRLRAAYERGFQAGLRHQEAAEKIKRAPPDITERERLGDAMGRAAAYWIQEQGSPNRHVFYIPSKELRAFVRDIHSQVDFPVRQGFGVPHPSRITVLLKRHLDVMVPMMARLLKAEPKLSYDASNKTLRVVLPTGWRFPARTT